VDKSKPARASRIVVLLLAALALVLSACTSSGGTPHSTATKTVTDSPSSSSKSTPTSSAPAKPSTIVHVSSLLSDGSTYGVGMPIVLYFKPVPKSVKAFEQAVKVTVNGQPANGAWYWEQPLASEVSQHMVEAHYRLQNYWPAHSKIHVSIPIGGVSAGPGMAYAGALNSLTFNIGAAHVSYVNAVTKRMQVTSDGKTVRDMEVSLGTAQNPTYNGIKVVMQKGEDVPGTNRLRPNGQVLMSATDGSYRNAPVDWSVRITQSGEYVHAAPWNGEIGQANLSHGCTNLHTADGEWFYKFSQIGDVVKYSGTNGTLMLPDDGFGDWNLTWGAWQQGGMFGPA